MFRGKKIDPTAALIEVLEKQIASLTEERDYLRKKSDRLEDALIAAKSPEAYESMKVAELEVKMAESQSMTDDQRLEAKLWSRALDEIERPIFKDPRDMIDSLSSVFGVPQAAAPHENDES